ncbi:MAG: uracil-DNA glycosylase [Holosporales bacterium]|jgi:DNA polymerase|nr:uracil-DNA glycosylase [Holosporales bacterium]
MSKKVACWAILQDEFGEELVLANNKSVLKKVQGTKKKREEEIRYNPAPSVSSARPVPSPPSHTKSITHTQKADVSNISSITALKEAVHAFNGCELKKTATNTVFGDGPTPSDIMLIGEAPGLEEDKQGLPFVGQSGKLLSKMLESIGLSREKVYITNVVNWRPPGNRVPEPEEIEQCRPFLEKHIELINPKVIVLLGATAMRAVLQINTGLSRVRNVWHYYTAVGEKKIKTMVTFHPSYLLRSPGQKVFAWEDFMMLKEETSECDR